MGSSTGAVWGVKPLPAPVSESLPGSSVPSESRADIVIDRGLYVLLPGYLLQTQTTGTTLSLARHRARSDRGNGRAALGGAQRGTNGYLHSILGAEEDATSPWPGFR